MHRLFVFLSLLVSFQSLSRGSEWNRFTFEGNQSFSSEQLLDALLANADFLIATHPRALLSELPPIVEQLLVRGYKASGFHAPQVAVFTEPSTRGALIRILEGRRFRCGQVIVKGTSHIDQQALINRLTKPYLGKNMFTSYQFVNGVEQPFCVDENGKAADLVPAVWKIGEFVKFHSQDVLGKQVRNALEDLGYSQTNMRSDFGLNESNNTADLVLTIVDEGAQDRIEEIHISGLKENSRDELLTFLDLGVDAVADRHLVDQINQKLWNSARFISQKVSITRSETKLRPNLLIELEEFPGLPPLKDSLSAESQVFLKARLWASSSIADKQDIVVETDFENWDFIFVQSVEGTLVKMTEKPSIVDEAKTTTIPPSTLVPRFAVVLLEEDQLLLCFSPLGQKFSGLFDAGEHQVNFGVGFGAAKEPDLSVAYKFDFAVKGRRLPEQAPVQLSVNLRPVDFAAIPCKRHAVHAWDGDALRTTLKESTFHIDSKTGRCELHPLDSTLKLESGRFALERNLAFELTKDMRETYDAMMPATTMCAYLSNPDLIEPIYNYLTSTGEKPSSFNRPLCSASQKLLRSGLLRPIDHVVLDPSHVSTKEDRFKIPDETPPGLTFQALIIRLIGNSVVSLSSKVFPEDSWPLLVARETGFIMLGHSAHTAETLRRIHDDANYGPLCNATVAILIKLIRPDVSKQFAARALHQLNEASFVRDYDELTVGATGEWLQALISAVQSLEPEEIDALGTYLKEPQIALLLKSICQVTKVAPDSSAGSIWFHAIQSELRNWLLTQR